MRTLRRWNAPFAAVLMLAVGFAGGAAARSLVRDELRRSHMPPWKDIEMVFGRPGQSLPGEVFKIALPRTDLRVTVRGVRIVPALALGSWAAFMRVRNETMVMGDLVLLDREVNRVLSRLLASGFEVTALHNHLNDVSPHVLYLHYSGHGDAAELARGLREALAASATPLGAAPSRAPAGGPALDTRAIERALGRRGTLAAGGVYQVSVPRAERITDHGMEIPPSMGVATALNFQPLAGGHAAITGDFVLTAEEVNPVARALRDRGIEVTAIHNHGLRDQPRLFYMHFWAADDAVALARGLRAALGLTNSAR